MVPILADLVQHLWIELNQTITPGFHFHPFLSVAQFHQLRTGVTSHFTHPLSAAASASPWSPGLTYLSQKSSLYSVARFLQALLAQAISSAV